MSDRGRKEEKISLNARMRRDMLVLRALAYRRRVAGLGQGLSNSGAGGRYCGVPSKSLPGRGIR